MRPSIPFPPGRRWGCRYADFTVGGSPFVKGELASSELYERTGHPALAEEGPSARRMGPFFLPTRAQQNVLRSLLLSGSGKLHHGDCVGADEQAHDIARALGRAGVIHPASLPDQRAFKSPLDIRQPKPPLVRNKVIVRETALLVAAPADAMEQHRSGTWPTVRFARKLGRAICVIRPDGTLIPERGKP